MIDFHTHIFPDAVAEKTIPYLERVSHQTACTNGTKEGLKNSMEEAGISVSVVLPVVTKPSQFASILHFAEGMQEAPFISFGGIHPESSHYKEELLAVRNAGLKGIKLHPDYQGVDFHDIRCKRILDRASELDLIVSVHAGVDIGFPSPVHCTPEMIKEVIGDVHPKNLVLAHMGGWKLWDRAEELLTGEDVWLDTAFSLEYMPQEQLLRMIKKHGAGRILLATDSPWSSQKDYVKRLNALPISMEEKEQIGWKNAEQLLHL